MDISKNEVMGLYPIEIKAIILTEDVLKKVEYGDEALFKMNLLLKTIDTFTIAEIKQKYLKSIENLISRKAIKASSIRIWKADFSRLQEIYMDFKENCKKCSRNYCFYMKYGTLLDENKPVILSESEGLFFDIREKDFSFHLINAKWELITRCENCSILTINPLFCICKTLGYCSMDCLIKDKSYHMKTCTKDTEENDIFMGSFQMRESSIKGVCGLKNLGNSCYMNSALQCLSNCFDLTHYFLQEYFREEINKENKLGSQGKVAMNYAEFLRNVWCEEREVFSPNDLKAALLSGKNFGENSQEDSQEFLAYLLDMLHEDLNRCCTDLDELNTEENSKVVLNEISIEEKEKYPIIPLEGSMSMTHLKGKTRIIPSKGKSINIPLEGKEPFNFLEVKTPIFPLKVRVPILLDDTTPALFSCKKEKKLSNDLNYLENEDNAKKEACLAQESWNSYIKKNNSIIVELFTGQFKSQISCPGCNKVSITFDPFLTIPLPIPLNKNKCIKLFLIRKELALPKERLTYHFRSEKDRILDIKKKITYSFALDSDLFIWKENTLTSLKNDDFRLTYSLYRELKANKATLLAYEKLLPLDKGQINSLLFFYKQNTSNIFLSNSPKTSLAQFPRFLPLSPKITYKELYERLSLYLRVFLEGSTKKSLESPPSFLKKLFPVSSPKAPSYHFKLFRRKEKERELLELDSFSSLQVCLLSELPSLELEIVFLEEEIKSLEVLNLSKPSIDLNLILKPIATNSNEITLQECLQSFSKEEILEEKNEWYCEECKCFRRALKKLEVYRSPQILIFQLKRFKSSKSNYKSKILERINFPINDLDLSGFLINSEFQPKGFINGLSNVYSHRPSNGLSNGNLNGYSNGNSNGISNNNSYYNYNRTFSNRSYNGVSNKSQAYGKWLSVARDSLKIKPKILDDEELLEEDEIFTISTENTINNTKGKGKNEGMIYDLVGVIEHKGNMGYGHYIAKCRNVMDKKWHVFDDNEVTEEEEDKVVSDNAYILFYKRKINFSI